MPGRPPSATWLAFVPVSQVQGTIHDKPFSMPPHRRLLAWIVTDRVGQGLALTVMFTWAIVLYARARLAGKGAGAIHDQAAKA